MSVATQCSTLGSSFRKRILLAILGAVFTFEREGGSIANTDAGNGNLANFRLSQVYLLSGNNIPNLIWQLGTLESYFGDLGLYDMRPAMVFTDTVGISGRYQTERSELLIGVGDAGYAKYGAEYNTVWTSGFTLRHRPIDQLEFGIGGQGYLELGTPGNRNAPYTTQKWTMKTGYVVRL